jgi:RNA polymerase sigma-70 factor (ECF subfamily)
VVKGGGGVKEVGNLTVFAYNGFHMADRERQSARKAGNSGRDDTEARFLKAFDEFSDPLFRHALYRLSDRERAIDVVHDTFTKTWGYARSGYEIESYKSFLYKVLNNLIIDEYRRRREQSLDALLEVEGVSEAQFADLTTGSLEEVTSTLDARRVLDLIPRLPPVYREVVVMRFIDGLGPKEISDLIEESENVVSVRLHRAVRYLREYFEESNRPNRPTPPEKNE